MTEGVLEAEERCRLPDGPTDDLLRRLEIGEVADRFAARPRDGAGRAPREGQPRGPASHGTAGGAAPADEARLDDLAARLVEGLAPSEARLVHGVYFRSRPVDAAAAEAGCTPASARRRLLHLGERLRERALAPLQSQLSEIEWGVVDALLVRRMSARLAALALGHDAEGLEDEARRLLCERVEPLLGPRGMAVFGRLLRA